MSVSTDVTMDDDDMGDSDNEAPGSAHGDRIDDEGGLRGGREML